MVVTRLGRVYAKALLELAVEKSLLEEVKQDVDLIAQVIRDNRELGAMLKSPVVKADKKGAILTEIFEKHVGELTMRFLKVVLDHGREASMLVIAQGFENLYLQHKGIEKVKVTTAYALDDKEVTAVKAQAEKMTGKKVVLEQEVDESMIGGMILRVKDQRYNGSLAHHLKSLRRQFKDNHYIKEF